MLKKLLALLNTLPLNGDKTKIGLWLTGLTAIWASLQELAPQLTEKLLAALTTYPINWAAVGVIVLGLVHKYLKKRFGFRK